MPKKRTVFVLLFILLVSLLLRLYNLNHHSFWYDESLSLLGAKFVDFQNILNYGRYVTEPPIFFILLKYWTAISRNDSFFRLLPLFFGLLSVISVYLLGRILFNNKAGLISAFLLGISPFHIYYSRELRSYTLFVFLAILSVYFFVLALREKKSRLWALFVLFTTLGLYTHNLFILLVLAEDLFFLFSCKKHKELILKWMISQSVLLFLYLPWIIMLARQILNLGILSVFFWVPKPSLETLIHTFNIFNLGYNASRGEYLLSNFIFWPLFIWGVYKGKSKDKQFSLLLYWLLAPLLMAIIISVSLEQSSIFLYRTFIYLSVAYYLIIAKGLSNIRGNKTIIAVCLLISLLVIPALNNYYHDIFPLSSTPYRPSIFVKKDCDLAAKYVDEGFQEGDAVAHTCRSTLAPFLYYRRGALNDRWVVSSSSIDYTHWDNVFFRDSASPNLRLLVPFLGVDIQKLAIAHKRIWLVYSGWEFNDRESPEIREWLDANCRLSKKKEFGGIDVYLYNAYGK
jgi:uncharacterized membrane protein